MTFNRRHFCSALAISSTGIIGGTVSAQSEVQISGTITSAVGADIEGVELLFQQVDTNSFWRYTVPASGDIDLTVSETGTFRVRSFDTSARKDNVPLVYSFGRNPVDDTGATVSYTLPQSYDVTIQCVDTDGTPVEDLAVLLRAGGTSHQPGLLTTSEQGYVTFDRTEEITDQPELQLAGPTTVELSKNDSRQPLGEIDVTENAEYEFEVANIETYTPNYTKIEPNSDDRFNYPYFLYTPPTLTTSEESPRPILVSMVNTIESDNDLTTFLELARGEIRRGRKRDIADGVNIPLLIPVVPKPDGDPEPWHFYPTHLDPDIFTTEDSPLERVDLQLLAMIEDASSRLEDNGYNITTEIHMDGFSSDGHFANRFTMLHPERINAASYGGIGQLILPKTTIDDDVPAVGDPQWDEMKYPIGTDEEELPYPIGVANFEALTGSSFNEEAWFNTPQYIYIGDEDNPDPDPRSSSYRSFYNLYDDEAQQIHPSERSYAMPDLVKDIYGLERFEERFEVSRAVYENVGGATEFTMYEGYGHTDEPAIEDLVEFDNNEIQNAYGPIAKSEDTTSREGEELKTSDNPADDSGGNKTASNPTNEESPGFGFGIALSGIVGAGYIVKRRFESDT